MFSEIPYHYINLINVKLIRCQINENTWLLAVHNAQFATTLQQKIKNILIHFEGQNNRKRISL